MGRSWVIALMAVLLAIVVGIVFRQTVQTLAYDKVLRFDDESCVLLPLPTPAEDLSALGDGHCAIAGGGDVWQTFTHGAVNAADGAVWLINATRGTAQQLKVSGAKAPQKLILHGIYFSQRTRRLYAVNHDEEHGESVEIFDVISEANSVPPLRLVHLSSVRSPLFGNLALNDVVEGADAGEFYVSEWQPLGGLPVGGTHATDVPLQVRARRALYVPLTLIKAPLTRVFHCTTAETTNMNSSSGGDGGTCTVASSARFVGANGLAVSADRRTVFVNDAPAQSIRVMAREEGGALRAVSKLETKHVVDNIEMTADGTLSAGSNPLPYTSGSVCDEAPALARNGATGGREVGCGRSPGGQLTISLAGSSDAFLPDTQIDARMHDGSLLSGVSAAIPVGDKVLMGGPDHPGVLVCDGRSEVP